MKKYFIKHEGFGNVYSLFYTTDGSEPVGAERITRKQAESFAGAEARRRLENSAFSGYADAYVWPYNMAGLPGVHGKPSDPDFYIDADNILSWAEIGSHGYKLSGRVIIHSELEKV